MACGGSFCLSVIALVDTRAEYQHLLRLYLPVALAVFTLITATVAVVVVRARGRARERVSERSENNVLEGAYVLALVVVAAGLLVATFRAEHRVDTVAQAETPGLTIDVVASKWEWHFHYPAYGIDQYSGTVGHGDLVVPTGTPVRFRLDAADVIHAFWIPDLRFKRDLIPGASNYATLVFARAGYLDGECAEFCGLWHSSMLFRAHAVSPQQFRAWASARRAPGAIAAAGA